MRRLNEDEQYIVRKIVSSRRKLQIQEMCLATIMDESLDSLAIEWNTNQVTVFAKKKTNPLKPFMALCDIISLFSYLEKKGLILVHSNPDLLQEKALYNHNMYKKEGDKYVSLDETGISINIFGEPYVFQYSIPSQHSTTIYSDFPALMDKYSCAFIHPTQELVDYVDNGFKTKDDLQYESTIKISRWALGVAIIIGIISILVDLFSKC